MLHSLAHKIVSQPRVYDWVQKAVGAEEVGRFLAPHLAESAGHSLLDVGAGTGNNRKLLPDSTRYIWMDNDAQKLSGYRAKQPRALGVLGDATQLSFRDKCVDYALCTAVFHHLNDVELGRLVDELARVIRRRLIAVDAVECLNRPMSNLLWKYDRGSFPRTAERIRAALSRRFDLQFVDELTVYHRYILCIANPKG
jgi:ubiquinone/menaquinone biosynthesis C-methylase UbiE